jgi:PadR family transcriptional regulator, regulatory protein PadR
MSSGIPPGTLVMLTLRVLVAQPLHGYAIAQRIHTLSKERLQCEEGSLYPALQKLLIKGWVRSRWTISDSGRKVKEYSITPSGRKQLDVEVVEYRRIAKAIGAVLEGI